MALSQLIDGAVDLTEAGSEAVDTKLRAIAVVVVAISVLLFLLILFAVMPYFALAVAVLIVIVVYLLRDDGGDLI